MNYKHIEIESRAKQGAEIDNAISFVKSVTWGAGVKDDSVKPDMVNHPPHYKDASGIECCQVTDLMMFNAASCFKYLYRCGDKWDDIEDLKKAVWYAKRSYLIGDNEQPNSLEWDNNVKEIASYREHGIYRAMTAMRSYSWLAVAVFIGDEIARLESE